MAQMLADMLHELGILVIGPDQVGRLKKFPVTPHVRQAAIERFLAGLSASQQMVMQGETQSARQVASAIRPVFAAQIITRLEEIRAREINRI